MLKRTLFLAILAVFLVVAGCDENEPPFHVEGVEIHATATPGTSTRVPEVHGTVKVSPSPFDPIEIRFREEQAPEPTPEVR